MTSKEAFTGNLEFMLSGCIEHMRSSSIRSQKVGLTFLYSLVKLNLRDISSNPATKKTAETLVGDLIKLCKDSGNEVKILAIRILVHLTKMTSFTDSDVHQILDAMIDTSDKSYSNEGLIALKKVINFRKEVN